MKISHPNDAGLRETRSRWPALWSLVAIAALLITLLAVFRPRSKAVSSESSPPKAPALKTDSQTAARESGIHERLNPAHDTTPAETAEETVSRKVRQFGQKRRAIAERMAQRLNREMPPEIEAFFDAIDNGNWEEIDKHWKELRSHTYQYEDTKNDRPDLTPYWSMVLDAYGVAEQAHEWPARKLLDYGNAILDSLRPNMVYVGGTDNGRWVPALLSETSGDPHIVVTQNALADATYLEYVRELYGDRFNPLSQEDSQQTFQEYTADARKRLQHDLDFPDEPKQVRPGENIKLTDGRVQVSGQVAVMAINEKLLQRMMAKNPELSFAIQESFPLRGTYAEALPLGPLMELGAQNAQNDFTSERATQSVDYWRSVARSLLADPEAANSTYTLRAYSHDVNSTANLLASHNFMSQAEEAYRLASQIVPGSPEAVSGLANILDQTGRAGEARRLLENFARQYPENTQELEKIRGMLPVAGPPAKPAP
jgi:hypothetical protein